MKALIATDGSQNAYDAAKLFANLPHNGPLEVHILTVIYMPPDDSGGMAYAWLPEFIQSEEARARENFVKISALFQGEEVVTSHLICHGHVGHTITEEARKINADLIVIGAQGHSAISRVLLGSTSDFVATQASCSVLAVRVDKLPATVRPLRVAIAYDGSEPSRVAVDEFAKSSWGPKCEVHLVHVLPHASLFSRAVSVDLEAANQRGKELLAGAVKQLQPVVSKVTSHVLEGDSIGQVISDFIGRNEIDFVMMGETGRSALSKLFLGSVTRFVLHHADCSVWVSREHHAAKA
jgi:nucleotide-binding universal stress UspA family protein